MAKIISIANQKGGVGEKELPLRVYSGLSILLRDKVKPSTIEFDTPLFI